MNKKYKVVGIKDKDIIMFDTENYDLDILIKRLDEKYPGRVWIYGCDIIIMKK